MTTETMPALASETSSVDSLDQIALSETDRSRLYMCIHSGKQSASERMRAPILLKLGEG